MTFQELSAIRLNWDITVKGMARMIGVADSTYVNWSGKGEIPQYAEHSVKYMLALNKTELAKFTREYGVDDF